MNNKIAIFWWAFNPPTIWHTWVITQVLQETNIDKIILSPDGHRLDKNYGISIEDKIKIAHIYADTLQEKWLNVEMDSYFLEGKNNGPTTTVAVDKYFREKYGPDIWHIFWSDTISSMKDWEGNTDKYIETTLQKVLLKRPGFPIDPNKHGIENYIEIDSKFIQDISSTMVRNMISEWKMKVAEIIASTDILRYIQEQNLYTNN